MHHVITLIQGAEETGSYTWAFLDIVGASVRTSRYITKTAKRHGL